MCTHFHSQKFRPKHTMQTVRLLQTFVTLYGIFTTATGSCPDSSWYEKQGSCFIVSSESKNNMGATQTCRNRGAHLIYLNNGRGLSFVNSLPGITNTDYLIGAHRSTKYNPWTWKNGDPIMPLTITFSQDSQLYAQLRRRHSGNELHGVDGNWAGHFICEKQATAPPAVSSLLSSSSSLTPLESSISTAEAAPSSSPSPSSPSATSSSSLPLLPTPVALSSSLTTTLSLLQPTLQSSFASHLLSNSSPLLSSLITSFLPTSSSPSLSPPPPSSSSLISSSSSYSYVSASPSTPPSLSTKPSSTTHEKPTASKQTVNDLIETFIYNISLLNSSDPHSLEVSVNMMDSLLEELEETHNVGNPLLASRALEEFALQYTEEHQRGMIGDKMLIEKSKLVLLVQYVSNATSDYIFPTMDVTAVARVTIPYQNIAAKGTSVVTIVYSSIENLIETKSTSKIIATAVKPNPGRLVSNITLQFKTHKNKVSKDCVFWDFSLSNGGGWSSNRCSLVAMANSTYTTCSCDHLTHFAVLMRTDDTKISKDHDTALSILTYIGLGLSILGCVMTSVAYYLFTEVSSEQSQIRINLSSTLALAHVFFLLGSVAKNNWGACVAVAALLQLFYLSSLCWMLAEGIQLYAQIVKVFNTRLKMKRIYAFAWGVPLCMVFSSICIAETATGGMKSYVTQDFCWLSYENHLVWAFIVPVFIIILANIALLIRVVRELINVNLHQTGESSTKMESLRRSIKAFVLLAPLLGVTWFTGLLYISGVGVASMYIFTILNSSQGFFIFVFHCLRNTEIQGRLKRKIEAMEHMRSFDHINDVTSNHGNKARLSPPDSRAVTPKSNDIIMTDVKQNDYVSVVGGMGPERRF